MDLLNTVYYFVLYFTPILVYLTLFKKSRRKLSVYSLPNWYHFIKLYFAKTAVKNIQRERRENLDDVTEISRESPQQLKSETLSDSQIIYGIDQKGNTLRIQIELRKHRNALVTIYLRLNNGTIYKLPNEPEILSCSLQSRQWRGAGLKIEILEPFRRLRITYNGFLRKHGEAEDSVEHIQFNFIWNAARKPLYYPQDLSVDLLSDAIAREQWKGGDWIYLLPEEFSYEQYGALTGFVKGENITDELYFNLASWRNHRRGVKNNHLLYRDLSIVAAAEDGTVFCVGARSFNKGCSHLKYGTIIFNNGDVHPVNESDIELYQIAEHKTIPTIFVVHFKAEKRSFKLVLHLNKGEASRTVSSEEQGFEMLVVPAECELNAQEAKAVVTFWYRKRGEGQPPPRPLISQLVENLTTEKLVVSLDDLECRSVAISGGKGQSLALLRLMKSQQFSVPAGFVVTTAAFQLHLKQNPELTKALDKLKKVFNNNDALEACKEIPQLFESTILSKETKAAIQSELEKFKDSTKLTKWAVRSSGTVEDSEELSSAGQNSTFLGCVTEEDISQSIKACWGSLFTFQSVKYRRQHGLPVVSEMAVVVQKMVPADAAGVLFTCHPSSGNTGEMVVASNYGLGESVVSAEVEPDTFIIHKTWDNKTSLKSHIVGKKGKTIVLSDKGSATEILDTDEEKSKTLSLTEEQVLQLGHIGVSIEKAFGEPRDIEWAFSKDQVYILQSRPITTLNPWTDFEMAHEYDTPILSEQDTVFTRANCSEVLPGALTDLSITTTVRLGDIAISDTVLECDRYTNRSLLVNHKTAFIDVMNTVFRDQTKGKDIMAYALHIAIFGHPISDNKMMSVAEARHGPMTFRRQMDALYRAMKHAFKSKQCMEKAVELVKENVGIREDDSSAEMYGKISTYFETFTEIMRCHCITTRASVFYQFIAMRILAENNTEFNDDHYHDIALLLSSCDGLVSVQVPIILAQIAEQIKKEGDSEEFIQMTPSQANEWFLNRQTKSGEMYRNFIKEHGHRGYKEFELMVESWETNPEDPIKTIQANIRDGAFTKKSKSLSIAETVSKLISPKSKVTRFLLKKVIAKCRDAVASRERTKSEGIRSSNKLKKAYKVLAKRLVEEGKLPSAELVYFLSHWELGKIIQTPQPLVINSRAIRKQRLFSLWDKLVFPELSFGLPKPLSDLTVQPATKNRDSTMKVKGTPVFPGEVTARACVITDINDAGQIQSGDILVTRCTDIGWSPYFPLLSAVCTELGGLMSHGAVVAREYGLPCVVGAENATRLFKTGDVLQLSGKNGVLLLVNYHH